MDPKQGGGNPPLDPKLQQAYDKVMGVNLSGPAVTTDPTASPAVPPMDPMATATGADAQLQQAPNMTSPDGLASPTMPGITPPVVPIVDPMATSFGSAQDKPAAGPTVNITMPGTIPSPTPPAPEPSAPTMPAMPSMPASNAAAPESGTIQSPTSPAAPVPAATPTDSMNATITMPAHHDTQTVKIGIGGSPVASHATTKGKGGISPIILIFGALAFLVVYGVFWVKFFGYNLPFLGQ